MAKNDGILGISVNHARLTMALIRGGNVQKAVWEEIPDNIVEGNKILSQNLFADFLREKMAEHGMHSKKAAYVLADSEVFVRTISMPKVSDDQLRYNIPFEFRDFIQGELKDYIFDFIKRDNKDPENPNVDLLAYAVPVSLVEDLRSTLRLAGLKLEKAIPETTVYETLIHKLPDEEAINKERCFMDIGRRSIRMVIFKNGMYKLSHVIDIGENQIIQAIADEKGVDFRLALTYLRTRFEDCDRLPSVVNAYKDISLEVLKGLNFYEMSDMSARLHDVVLCGTGAMTEPLVDILKERIDMDVITMDELLPKYDKDKEFNVTYEAIGILLNEAGGGIGKEGNIAAVGEKTKPKWMTALPAILVAAVVLILLAKFAVFDRYAELNKEQARVNELQDRIDADLTYIKEAGELSEEYYHYTWDGMTEEELGRVSRVEVAKLADFIATQGVKVRALSLKDAVLTISVVGDSLETMSKLTAAINDQSIVESCSLTSAQKEYVEETHTFTQTLTQNAANADAEEGEETEEEPAETQESSKSVSSNYVVNAEINVYLGTIESEGEEVEQ